MTTFTTQFAESYIKERCEGLNITAKNIKRGGYAYHNKTRDDKWRIEYPQLDSLYNFRIALHEIHHIEDFIKFTEANDAKHMLNVYDTRKEYELEFDTEMKANREQLQLGFELTSKQKTQTFGYILYCLRKSTNRGMKAKSIRRDIRLFVDRRLPKGITCEALEGKNIQISYNNEKVQILEKIFCANPYDANKIDKRYYRFNKIATVSL